MLARTLSSFAVALVVVLVVVPAAAQERPDSVRRDTARLATTVITATRLAVRQAAPAAASTTITGEELRARGVRTLSEVLATAPSAAPTRSGSFGATTSLFFRGGERDYVQVLIDGMPVNDPGGDVDLANLSTENVERIEIVRGPASALYGSEAMTGVIQIFTRQGDGPTALRAAARAGTHDTREGELELDGAFDRGGYSFAVARTATDGILAFNNRHRNTSLGGSVRFAPDHRSDARLAARWYDGRFHYPTDGDGNVVDRNAHRAERRLVASLDAGRWLTERVEGRVLLGATAGRARNDDAQDDADDTHGFYAFQSRTRTERMSADVRLNVHARQSLILTGGAALARERERTSSESESEFGPFVTPEQSANRLNRAVYAQLFANRGQRLTTTIGGRLEDNEGFGTFATYRAGVGARVAPTVTVRASAGSAFKAPTVLEHYGTSGFVIGNPNLDPERSRSWEAGADVDLADARVVVGVSYFDQHFRDMITTVPGAGGTFTYDNVSSASSRGVELEVVGRLSVAWTTRAAASWLRTRDEETGERLLRRPRFLASLTTSHRFARGSLSATVAHTGRRDDMDFSTFPSRRVVLGAHTVVDLAGEVTVLRSRSGGTALALTARAANLFDETYAPILNFGAPGRTVLIGARVQAGR